MTAPSAVRRETRSALSTVGPADETGRVGREELTDDGAASPRTCAPRPRGVVRYGDRFRPADQATALDLDQAGEGDRIDLGPDAPTRTRPAWLARGAAAIGVAAGIAVGIGDHESSPPQSAVDPPAQTALDKYPNRGPARVEPPSMAALVSSRVEEGVWDHGRFTLDQGRFSFEVTLSGAAVSPSDVDVLSETSSTCTYLGGPPRFGSTYWC